MSYASLGADPLPAPGLPMPDITYLPREGGGGGTFVTPSAGPVPRPVSTNVRDLQCKINGYRTQAGRSRISEDGDWGPGTRTAIDALPFAMPRMANGQRMPRYQNTTTGASTVRVDQLVLNWLARYRCGAGTAPARRPTDTVTPDTADTAAPETPSELLPSGMNWTPLLIGSAVAVGVVGLWWWQKGKASKGPAAAVTANRSVGTGAGGRRRGRRSKRPARRSGKRHFR